MAKKIFVLDTNILLNSPDSIFAFEDNTVIITEAVLEELDGFKKDKDERGANSREVIRTLEEFRQEGELLNGVVVNFFNGLLKIETNHKEIELPPSWNLQKADHRILQVCKALKESGEDVHLVTNDLLLRIKSNIIGITAEGFETDQVSDEDLQYIGRVALYVDDQIFDKYYKDGEIDIKGTTFVIYKENGKSEKYKDELYPNEFIILYNSSGSTAIGKVDYNGKKIKKLQYDGYYPYGIKPRNVVQKFMIEALMDDNIPLVIFKGVAGTAKTFLSLGVGLDKVIENQIYRKILCCRPYQPMGGPSEDIGFIPGTEEEKIAPYMRPILDNLEVLVDSDEKERYSDDRTLQSKVNFIMDKKFIDTQAIAFLRGRSINKQYIIIDESQNITKTQIKSIITRAGEGTKIILCGDPDQIDTPFLNKKDNGLSWVAEKMKGSSLCAQITTTSSECIRSKLAEDAIKRINE